MTTVLPPVLGPDELPLPFGIEIETGATLPGITPHDLNNIDADRQDVRDQGQPGAGAHLAIAEVDPNNLEEAGWCVVFAKDADPAIKKALERLLARREADAGPLFKVFEGADGIRPGEDPEKWVLRHGAAIDKVVDPANGVPVYITLVGSPQEIPFEFQYRLDLNWNVGRLHFDTADEYRDYAESVVAYETGATLPHKKRAAIFTVMNDGDRATGMLHNDVAEPLVKGSTRVKTLTGFKGFSMTELLAENATKERLVKLLQGKEDGGPPAFLFTGSHGVKVKMDDPTQREKQGAILCQDWPGFGTVAPEHLFTAADIPTDANVHGLIHFLFACYGGGCPTHDNFGLGTGQPPKQLMQVPIVARLPQRLLAKGALASVAHVDRAWAYSFQSNGFPQVQEMRNVMVRILMGQRVGEATTDLNKQWAVASAQLHEAQDTRKAFGEELMSNAQLATKWVARNDARNYIILGDPAVRLRTEAMTA